MATARLIIPYAPRRVFLPFHGRAERFAVGVAHRRCGKTVACINDMIRKAATTDKQMYRAGYVAPFLNQAKNVAWEYLKMYSRPLHVKPPNESELYVDLMTGSGSPARIRIYGADNADALRGGYFDDVTLDEYADMAPGVWGSIIRPMLSDRIGSATFIGTPKGRNAFHKIYDDAQGDPEWFSFMLRASETGITPETELASARRTMTPEEYEQEYECSFDAAIKGAYFGKEIADAERDGRIKPVPHDPELPVHTAWDLGMGDSTAIWIFQAVGGEVRVIGHYENHGQPLSHYVAELEARGQRGGWRFGIDYVPHDAKVRSLETGRTRVETLQSLGREPKLVPAHKLMDGINAARIMLPSVWFDATECAQGLEALRQYRTEFDEKTRAFKDTPKHDWTSHSADAFRYLCMAVQDDIRPAKKPTPDAWWTPPPLTMDEAWAIRTPQRRDRV